MIGKSWRPALPHLAALQVLEYFGPLIGDEGDGGELWKEMREILSVVVTVSICHENFGYQFELLSGDSTKMFPTLSPA